jgi:hypothetical protein
MGEVVDGELVLLNLDSGQYFGLNRTGTRIWELLGSTPHLDDVERVLAEQYRIEPSRARQDLDELIAELERAGLVHEAPEG